MAHDLDSNDAGPPLSIARQGYLFAGGTIRDEPGRPMAGQLYAEFQIPHPLRHPFPIIMVHGGGQTGTNFTGTPDGREGWAQFFLRRGYAVYVADQVGRGRAAYWPDVYGASSPARHDPVLQRFTAPATFKLWPQAHLHTQFPGTGLPGDPVFEQFYASQVPAIASFAEQQRLNAAALVALLDKVGPAILLTHSQSGTFQWPVADARPHLIKALVAVEPNGPPVHDVEFHGAPDYFSDAEPTKPSGLGHVPLAYSPPVTDDSPLRFERQARPDAPSLVPCWRQKEPARTLPNLQHIPLLILTAEASYHAPYDHCTSQYLEQAGVRHTFVRLADRGIRGNGHMMMLEKNNQEIAAVIADWLENALASSAAR
ncbi:MAG TPA: alpha/beta hydrolase [Alphaproteobacteria bacterium]|nr:alpha/beta hydrolase [Alphaproteobacteria bacterium]